MHLFYLRQREFLSDSKYTPTTFIFSLLLLSQRKAKRKGVRKIKRKKEKIFYRVQIEKIHGKREMSEE